MLKRPEQRAISGLSSGQIDAILTNLSGALEPVIVRFSWRPQLRDADDEMVLDAAINGQAEALITHILADFAAAGPSFWVKVVSPGAFLREIMA